MNDSRLLRDYLISITSGYEVSINNIIIITNSPFEIIGTYRWNDYHGSFKENVEFKVSLMELIVFSYDILKNEIDEIKPIDNSSLNY